MTVHAVSYGGGVQSSALLVLQAEKRLPADYPLFLFSNVGDDSEHPATLRYVWDVAIPYAKAHGIELVELRKRPKGKETTLYERLTNPASRSIGIPVRMDPSGAPGRRSCTLDFKIRRIAAELKRRGATADDPAVIALGISLDEATRMRTDSGIAWETLSYPLVDLRLDREACRQILMKAGLPVPPKSSCWFCPFHSLNVWKKMKREEPDLFTKAVALEAQLADRHQRLGRGGIFMTNEMKPLDQAVGDYDQLELFEDGPTCDIGGYCMA